MYLHAVRRVFLWIYQYGSDYDDFWNWKPIGANRSFDVMLFPSCYSVIHFIEESYYAHTWQFWIVKFYYQNNFYTKGGMKLHINNRYFLCHVYFHVPAYLVWENCVQFLDFPNQGHHYLISLLNDIWIHNIHYFTHNFMLLGRTGYGSSEGVTNIHLAVSGYSAKAILSKSVKLEKVVSCAEGWTWVNATSQRDWPS